MYSKLLKRSNHPIHDKIEVEGAFLMIVASMYKKPIANIVVGGEKLKAFLLRSSIIQGCTLSPLFFNIVLDVLAPALGKKMNSKDLTYNRGNDIVSIC